MKASVLGAVLAVAFVGCQTYERTLPDGPRAVRQLDDDENSYALREEELVEATEDEPDEPRTWFMLAKFMERSGRFVEALDALFAYQASLERLEARTLEEHGREIHYTSGHHQIGRIFARMKRYGDAVVHFQRVLELKPKTPSGEVDVPQASLNSDFLESHYLLAAIYFEHGQYETAREQLLECRVLTGHDDLRIERLLMDVDARLAGVE